jgi:ribosomal protein S18 acetylase RimI-like enzyme
VGVVIAAAVFPRDAEVVRGLFREYADRLGFDLCFQGFEEELRGLPGGYAAPAGALFLAWDGPAAAGCVGVRRFGGSACEMKRLYVRASQRRRGLGRRLATIAVDEARRLGYACIRLDTVPWMREAAALYRSMGFRTIEPYRPNPIPGAVYMELTL